MLKKAFKMLGTFILISLWLLSGWPVIWQNPRIPPEIQKAEAATTFINVAHFDDSAVKTGTVNKPANTADDDIMFAVIMRNNNIALTVTPTGWSKIAEHQYSTTYHQYLFYKVAASEGSSYTWTWGANGRIAITIATYRGGFNTADPIDVVSNTEYITSSSAVRSANMSVAAANSVLLNFATFYSTTVRTFTKPSVPTTDWVENYDGGQTTSDFSREISSMVWTGSGATGNIDAIASVTGIEVKHGFAVALKRIPTVTTQEVSSVEATTSTGNGNITATGGENADKRGFVYDTSTKNLPGNVAPAASGYVSSAEDTGSFSTGAFTKGLTSLNTGTTYYTRAYAHNSAGYSYGNEVSFLTKPGAPTIEAFTNIQSTTLTVNWTAPAGGASSYKVERCSGSGCSDFSQITSGETNLYYNDSGLSEITLYRYRVRATNATGDGAYSGIGEVTTNVSPIYSVTISPEGTIEYGIVPKGESKSTIQLGETRTATNNGNTTANFNIKTSKAVNGTEWSVGSGAGENIFVHEFSTNGGGAWTKFENDIDYKTLATGVEVDGTIDFDLRITVPTDSDTQQKTITITVQATE